MDFFSSDTKNDVSRVLSAWRIWTLVMILGGLLGAGLFQVAPPPYRAHADVVLDFNIEEAWTPTQDKQAFYYLEREVSKLIEIAWSDDVMQAVAQADGAIGVVELRNGKLLLSQPREGGWTFWAEDEDPQRAQSLAASWARAFNARLQEGVTASMTLQAFHAEIQNGCGAQCADLQSKIAELESRSLTVSPYIESYVVQASNLTVSRRVSESIYIFFGALAGMCLTLLYLLFANGKRHA